MICYYAHDKHLTKINLNKFSLLMCPLFKENSDIFFVNKKIDFVKKNQIFFFSFLFFSFFVYKRKNKIFVKKCRDSFFSPIPHGGWDLGPAGPIQ